MSLVKVEYTEAQARAVQIALRCAQEDEAQTPGERDMAVVSRALQKTEDARRRVQQ